MRAHEKQLLRILLAGQTIRVNDRQTVDRIARVATRVTGRSPVIHYPFPGEEQVFFLWYW